MNTIEIRQLLLHSGVFELDDFINNTVGAIVGIVAAKIMKFCLKPCIRT